jgi:hypothetical protein
MVYSQTRNYELAKVPSWQEGKILKATQYALGTRNRSKDAGTFE